MLERAYERPEEHRVANVFGAELRSADLSGTDSYLVELRGACLDLSLAESVRRRGAIVDER